MPFIAMPAEVAAFAAQLRRGVLAGDAEAIRLTDKVNARVRDEHVNQVRALREEFEAAANGATS